MTLTNLANNPGTGAVASITTSSVSPVNGTLLIVAVGNNHDNISTNVPTVSGLGLTWTQIITQNDVSGTQGERVTLFRAVVSGSPTGTLTIDFGGQTQSNSGYSIDQITGADTGNAGASGIVQSNSGSVNGSSQTVTLSTFKNIKNIAYAAFANGGGSTAAGSGFTAITATTSRFFAEYAVNNTACAYTFSGANDSVGAAIEIAQANFGGSFILNLL